MGSAWKGALLSGLVFPGLGQVVQRRYARGLLWILAVLAAVVAITWIALQKALAILEKMEAKGSAVDMSAITSAARQASSTENLVVHLAFIAIVVLWALSIVDAFLIGRKKDLEAKREDREGGTTKDAAGEDA